MYLCDANSLFIRCVFVLALIIASLWSNKYQRDCESASANVRVLEESLMLMHMSTYFVRCRQKPIQINFIQADLTVYLCWHRKLSKINVGKHVCQHELPLHHWRREAKLIWHYRSDQQWFNIERRMIFDNALSRSFLEVVLGIGISIAWRISVFEN